MTQQPTGTPATPTPNSPVSPEQAESQTPKDDLPSNRGFPGPGQSASSPKKPRGHSSKVLNKLDPRLNADLLEAKKRGEFDAGGEDTRAAADSGN